MSSPPSASEPPQLQFIEITKRFGSFVANDKVSLNPGSFHALLGRIVYSAPIADIDRQLVAEKMASH